MVELNCDISLLLFGYRTMLPPMSRILVFSVFIFVICLKFLGCFWPFRSLSHSLPFRLSESPPAISRPLSSFCLLRRQLWPPPPPPPPGLYDGLGAILPCSSGALPWTVTVSCSSHIPEMQGEAIISPPFIDRHTDMLEIKQLSQEQTMSQ